MVSLFPLFLTTASRLERRLDVARNAACLLSCTAILGLPSAQAADPAPQQAEAPAADAASTDRLDCRVKDATADFFPATAKRLRLTGRVLVDADLAPDGSVFRPVVIASDRTPRWENAFDRSALEFVGSLVCKPLQPSVLGSDAGATYRFSIVFEYLLGGTLLPYPVSDMKVSILATPVPDRPPQAEAQ